MKIKRFFFSKNISLVAAFLSFAAAPLMAALPSSPLDGEFTTSSNEHIYADWWWKLEIGPSGVWNIAGDLAQVYWGYEGYNNKILTGSGTINIGSDTEAGSLYIMGQNPPSDDNYWDRILDFNGTVNVGKSGSFSFGGTYHSRWGMIGYIDTLNVNGGMVSVMSETQNNSYFCVKNLAVRDGGTFESSQDLQTAGSGVWDLYSQGVSSSLLRVSSGNFTLNLHSENVLNQLPRISFDDNRGTNFRINASADNSIGELEFNGNAVLELSVADGATLTIKTLATKNDAHAVQNAEIIFYDYRADAVLFEDPYIFVEDDRLCLSAYETYVKLTAYDGEGNLLQGVWTYEWDEAAGLGKLVLAAVPEPTAIAAVLGALALAFAMRRRRK